MVKNSHFRKEAFFFVLFFFFLSIAYSFAQNAAPKNSVKVAKARMLKRLNIILQLKQKGIVGENNRGYLTLLRGKDTKYKALVDEENRDRRIIYEYIATREGVDLSTVERLRARQIRQRAPKGQWIQAPDGKWVRK